MVRRRLSRLWRRHRRRRRYFDEAEIGWTTASDPEHDPW